MVIVNNQVWLNIQAQLKKLDAAYVKVGYPSGGTPAAGGTGAYFGISGVATIAAFQEFGTKQIATPKQARFLSSSGFPVKVGQLLSVPARSFMRTSFDENLKSIELLKAKYYEDIVNGVMTAEQALRLLGEFLLGKTKQKVQSINSPALHPFTLSKKNSTKPLITTGQMINSLQIEVVGV